jgi:hypothetical protein
MVGIIPDAEGGPITTGHKLLTIYCILPSGFGEVITCLMGSRLVVIFSRLDLLCIIQFSSQLDRGVNQHWKALGADMDLRALVL